MQDDFISDFFNDNCSKREHQTAFFSSELSSGFRLKWVVHGGNHKQCTSSLQCISNHAGCQSTKVQYKTALTQILQIISRHLMTNKIYAYTGILK